MKFHNLTALICALFTVISESLTTLIVVGSELTLRTVLKEAATGESAAVVATHVPIVVATPLTNRVKEIELSAAAVETEPSKSIE